jgi:ribosomal protein S6--L-glutamate ligase
VVAAMKRQAPKGDFRSNLHRGGRARGVKATAAEQDVAIRAARVLGLGVAGVDLIRSKRGPLVLEVNASPGLEGIEDASGVDVAAEIVQYVSERHKRRAAKRAAAARTKA